MADAAIEQMQDAADFQITIGHLLPETAAQFGISQDELGLHQIACDREIALPVVTASAFFRRTHRHQQRRGFQKRTGKVVHDIDRLISRQAIEDRLGGEWFHCRTWCPICIPVELLIRQAGWVAWVAGSALSVRRSVHSS